MFKQLYYFLLALRPKQWIKNIIIFIPLLFSWLFTEVDSILKSIIIFFIFSIFVGCTYIFNDYKDIKKDKEHPTKKNRPLASWKLNKYFALSFWLLILILCLFFWFAYWWKTVWLLFLIYLINTLLYTLKLKNIEIIDVFSISIWFVIRWLIWTYVINVSISAWLMIILFFWSLRLWFLKRYQEVMLWKDTRENISKYNPIFLEQIISLITWIIIIGYSLYTFNSVQSERMVLTIPFITFLVIRYYYNIFFLKKYKESIENIILHDRYIIVCSITLFILIVSIILYAQ